MTLHVRVIQFALMSKGSVCESSRTLELFEGFDVQFWETGPWAPPPTFKSSQLVVYRMKPCHHCRAENGEP
jgi:hypothetical protein